jgi:hypothetical protein
MLSLAAWRALYQLVAAPYLWEKTEHGLAKSSRRATSVTRALVELERYLTQLKNDGQLPTIGDRVQQRRAPPQPGSRSAASLRNSAADRRRRPRAFASD